MARLSERIETAGAALSTLEEYKEAIAQRIFERLPAYAALMRELLGRFAQRQS